MARNGRRNTLWMHPAAGQSKNGKRAPPVLDENAFINGIDWQQQNGPALPEEETYEDKFRRSILDQTRDYPLPEPVVSVIQNGTELPLLTLMSFSLWQGKQKSRKTTVLAMAVAAFLRGRGFIQGGTEIIGSVSDQAGVVLWFDCEQGESYAARTMKRILRLADMETSVRLVYCNLREHVPQERRKIIEAATRCTPQVRMVVVDGIIDLLTDPAEPKEGHLIATTFLRWSSQYNIHVAGVLHQNKADKNARFHVGSFCSQKCEIEISTEVDSSDKSRSVVTCVNSRGMPFEDFAVRWDRDSPIPSIEQGWPVGSDALMEVKTDRQVGKKATQKKALVAQFFKPLQAYSFTEVTNEMMKTEGIARGTAKNWLNDFVDLGLVHKGDDNLYRLI